MDVATRHDTLWPKVATIKAVSVGWVHLVRFLHAVTLFGVGFGELFRPIMGKDKLQACCSPTASVPTGKDSLAVYGVDLRDMLRTGSRRRNPWRLAGIVHWHAPDAVAFESCRCKSVITGQEGSASNAQDVTPKAKQRRKGLKGLLGGFEQEGELHQPGQNPGDRVQVLLPATFPRLYGQGLRSPARVVSNGAVIFGHCWKFPLRWCLTKDIPPKEGEPDPTSIEEVSGLMSDGGIGTSVESPPSCSLYSLGSNVRFLHHGDSQSSWEGSANGLSERSGNEVEEVVPISANRDSKERSVGTLETERNGLARKVRRLESDIILAGSS